MKILRYMAFTGIIVFLNPFFFGCLLVLLLESIGWGSNLGTIVVIMLSFVYFIAWRRYLINKFPSEIKTANKHLDYKSYVLNENNTTLSTKVLKYEKILEQISSARENNNIEELENALKLVDQWKEKASKINNSEA